MRMTGSVLLQHVAERILGEWMRRQGRTDVRSTGNMASFGGHSVDMASVSSGVRRAVKVKPDTYFGTDQRRIADRSLTFYRATSGAYAFETVANAATREPGWMIESSADELFYYFIAITQTEEEIAALLGESDDVLLSELAVDRDELVIMPMDTTLAWFEKNSERYTPRPVTIEGAPAWYRLIPRDHIDGVVPGVRVVGPVLQTLLR